ncbi:acetyl-CoA carboxylase biotin carboxyl carrier protein [Neobacillus niacini]|uniref:acetyl-CoA carboxylase biotin carboxyl carrier protein n=1 Tax=Neobacillus niacini TaxID=86668 RepID=UPI002784B861|nr:acetyl-CoA carboxylase biotin carboxyl carrier protein [Neobacillus niacini]MDQ1002153.1 acetyl-CoA carboxylase biotin carboxyl carrier protein [Neobacillus niacini]
MFKINEIKELIRTVDRSTIGELTIKGENNQQITITKQMNVGQVIYSGEIQESAIPNPTPVIAEAAPVKNQEPPGQQPHESQAPVTNVDETSTQTINAPMVGTFYSSPTPESEPYVRVGDQISENTVLCIVEAMKLMNELEAEISGEVVDILVENGQVVEYGQPLFLVKTA